jgi:hypothetical protein
MPFRIAQLVIAKAKTHPNQAYNEFLRGFLPIEDHLLRQKINEDDLEDAVCFFSAYLLLSALRLLSDPEH